MARRPDPEDPLLRAMMKSGLTKGQAVATAKSRGLIRQSGRHLEPTAKGSKAIRKLGRKKRS